MFSNFMSSGKSRYKTILELASDKGAFNAYPGPVAVLDMTGNLLVANEEASRLAGVLRLGDTGAMDPKFREAILAGLATNVPIAYDHEDIESGQSERRTFDFQILPVTAEKLVIIIGRNTAFGSAFRGALAESRQRYKDLVEVCGDFLIFDFILVMTVILATIGVANTLLIQVHGREREFSVFRTIGMDRLQIIKMLIAEGLIVGFVGAFLAAIIGNILGAVSVSFLDHFTLFDYRFLVSFQATGLISLICIGTCLVAAIYPAVVAVRTSSAESLHYE